MKKFGNVSRNNFPDKSNSPFQCAHIESKMVRYVCIILNPPASSKLFMYLYNRVTNGSRAIQKSLGFNRNSVVRNCGKNLRNRKCTHTACETFIDFRHFRHLCANLRGIARKLLICFLRNVNP